MTLPAQILARSYEIFGLAVSNTALNRSLWAELLTHGRVVVVRKTESREGINFTIREIGAPLTNDA